MLQKLRGNYTILLLFTLDDLYALLCWIPYIRVGFNACLVSRVRFAERVILLSIKSILQMLRSDWSVQQT